MPIYAYRCEACGFARDVLQKISDAPLTECSACGKSTFKKQLTAAGFQLKGTGWYVTDFRGGAGSTTAPKAADSATSAAADGAAKPDGGAGAKTDSPAAAPAAEAKPTSSTV